MKLALTLTPGRVVVYEAREVYYIKASGDDSRIRTAGKTLHGSTQPLASWEKRLAKHGLVRIHRSYLVNVERIREIRHRKGDPSNWELKLDPPVNRVLPVSREGLRKLRGRLGF